MVTRAPPRRFSALVVFDGCAYDSGDGVRWRRRCVAAAADFVARACASGVDYRKLTTGSERKQMVARWSEWS